jgi:hypothetical protein
MTPVVIHTLKMDRAVLPPVPTSPHANELNENLPHSKSIVLTDFLTL